MGRAVLNEKGPVSLKLWKGPVNCGVKSPGLPQRNPPLGPNLKAQFSPGKKGSKVKVSWGVKFWPLNSLGGG